MGLFLFQVSTHPRRLLILRTRVWGGLFCRQNRKETGKRENTTAHNQHTQAEPNTSRARRRKKRRRRKRTTTAVAAEGFGYIWSSRRLKALHLVNLCDAHVCGAPYLCTCVSTQIPSFCPHPTSITRYAIFGPTPGRSRSPGCLRQVDRHGFQQQRYNGCTSVVK